MKRPPVWLAAVAIPGLVFASAAVETQGRDNQIDVTFKGSIDGDVMRLTMQVGSREPIAVTARRATGGI